MTTAGIILAAGESRRMGRPKASLPLRGGTFLSVLAATLGQFCTPVIAVLGSGADALMEALPEGVWGIVNADWQEGMLTSLQAGLRAVPEGCSDTMFTLVDHPAVQPATVASLLHSAEQIVIPRFEGRRGHPVRLHRTLFDEVLREPRTSQVRDIVNRHAEQIEYVEVMDPGIFDDIDDPRLYQSLLGARGGVVRFRFTPWRIVLFSLAALLVAAWYVPQISAERYRIPIQQGLEAALGRKVEMGSVAFRLLPAPGFTIENVRIGEDASIGIEPAVYVDSLRAVPRLSALLGGPIAFYWVDLEGASLNLSRVEKQNEPIRWNISSLMRPALLQAFPSIHVRGGRVNFKLSDTKSIFYLLNTDIDLWPPTREQSPWTFRVRTEPARTDAPARGFGSFTGRGEWSQSTGAITLDVKLEKSQLGEVLTLFAGHDTGMRGQVSGEAHLAGPSGKVGVRARLALADLHSWELAPTGQSAWPISIGGVINVPSQTIELRATTDYAPIDVRYRVAEFTGRPRWGVMAYFAKITHRAVAFGCQESWRYHPHRHEACRQRGRRSRIFHRGWLA